MNTLCIPDRPALQRLYMVAGRFLLVNADDAWWANVFSNFLERWYLAPIEPHGARAADAVIRIRSPQTLPSIPNDFVRLDLPGGGVCHYDGGAFFIELGKSLITLERDGSAEIVVWIGEDARESTPLADVVSYAVSAALRRCGILELHAGGVCETANGTGALIVGASGSGKSTLTLQLAAAGWRYLSDDVVLLREGRQGIEAFGLRRDFAVTEETLAASGLARICDDVPALTAFDPGKVRLPPLDLFPSGHVASCVPAAVFFPVITGQEVTSVEELSQSLSMVRLIRMCPWLSYDKCVAEGSLKVLAQLARQTKAYVISAGRDLLRDPGLAADVILARL